MVDTASPDLEPETNAEKAVSLPVAVAALAGVAVLVLAIGSVIGYRFFWEQNRTPSLREAEEQRWEYQLKKDPKDVTALFELGRVNFEAGNLAESEGYFNKALKVEPKADAARYYLGLIYIQKKQYNEAEKLFKKLLERDINNPLIFYNLATIYHETGRDKLALDQLDYIDTYIDDTLYEVHYLRGQVLEKQGKKQEALKAYERSASFNPDHKESLEAIKRLGGKPPKLPQ